jgi:nitrogenase iron protein NifH
MRQLAIYGKGGIGKSMIASHISFALANNKGLRVMHVGCDPKHDSTRLLLQGKMCTTILDTLRKNNFVINSLTRDEIIFETAFPLSRGKIFCAESGGPDPGLGCGGKGVSESIEALIKMNIFEELQLDAVLYDVLGDVVCGGFSMPIRQGYAEETYLVSSGELEALFAASNICKAVARFTARSGSRLGGIIGNLRELKNEEALLKEFAFKMNTQIIGFIPYSEKIKECSGKGATLFQLFPDSPECAAFSRLADNIWNNKNFSTPLGISFEELHNWWQEGIKK